MFSIGLQKYYIYIRAAKSIFYMKKKHFTIILLLLSCRVQAQVIDDFSDGDFTSSPSWTGDIASFKVNTSFELQLNSSGDNISALATACPMADSMEWNFKVRLAFSPSDNNNARIYLVSDQQDLKSNLNGYYLKLGESGSDDAIELIKQSGNIHTSLCRGTPGLLATAFTLRIRVIRDNSGNWSIFADPSGGNAYQPEATATDDTYTSASWLGIYCKYTSSNSTKFYFDDFYAGTVIIDKTPPGLLSASLLTSNALDLRFSESIDLITGQDVANYTLDHGIGHPAIVLRDAQDLTLVHLLFSPELTSDITYHLTIEGIKDLSGNEIVALDVPVSWHQVKLFDVLINEIMADPDPPTGLPESEYIELYNRSTFPVNLEGWMIRVGSSEKDFPAYTLPAGGFVILAANSSEPSLTGYGPFIGFSGFTIVNTGTEITLFDKDRHVIHSISFTEDWYRNDYKKEGGWSLEQIDPLNPCGEAANWIASNDASGGTPGKMNNANASNSDNTRPVIQRIGVDDPWHIPVWFSEPMDSTTLLDPSNCIIDQGIGNPASVTLSGPDYRKITMLLANPIVQGTIYTLTIEGSFTDCAGNMISGTAMAKFAIPSATKANELIINEVLFNPAPSCTDFVEIYNRSANVFDLQWLTLAGYDTVTLGLSDISRICQESRLIFPGEYYAVTTDTAAVKACYLTTNPGGFIQVSGLPSMNDDEGAIALALGTGEIIDRMIYSDKMHYPLLTGTEGVSLERINPEQPSSILSNWHSASETVGYATPAYQNSQYGQVAQSGNEISLSPSVFSPDNDGKDDYLTISYTFEQSGNNARVSVYDATGRLVRRLVNNELCGTNGAFTWDGFTDDRTLALAGRYIIYIDIFDSEGKVKHFKKTTVLGCKL